MPLIAKRLFTTPALALLLFGSTSAMAANLSFTGNFANDADVRFFDFSIAANSSSVLIKTFSLNGGANAAGVAIAGGGFDPYLSIWDKITGDWVFDTFSKNDGDEAVISGGLYGTLLAGDYILALTQNDNIAFGSNLSEGFAADYALTSFVPGMPFTSHGGGGSGHWALDILNVNAPPVDIPTPETLPLALIGLMALSPMTRRKARASIINGHFR